MERFVIIVNGFQPLTIITKCSILDAAAVLDPPLRPICLSPLKSWSVWIQTIIILFDRIGGESLCVAQNTYAVSWFKGRELNMVFGLQLSFSRVVSIYRSCYFYGNRHWGILANDCGRQQDIRILGNRLKAIQNMFLYK